MGNTKHKALNSKQILISKFKIKSFVVRLFEFLNCLVFRYSNLGFNKSGVSS